MISTCPNARPRLGTGPRIVKTCEHPVISQSGTVAMIQRHFAENTTLTNHQRLDVSPSLVRMVFVGAQHATPGKDAWLRPGMLSAMSGRAHQRQTGRRGT